MPKLYLVKSDEDNYTANCPRARAMASYLGGSILYEFSNDDIEYLKELGYDVEITQRQPYSYFGTMDNEAYNDDPTNTDEP